MKRRTRYAIVALLVPAQLAICTAQTTEIATDDGSGAYIGVGGGWSGYGAGFISGDYYIDDEVSGSTQVKSYQEDTGGYRLYGGYLFNQYIGIEAAYTDYGTMEFDGYSQNPEAGAVVANVGYAFLEGQLRPFGLLGLGYLKSNQSREILDEEFVTVHAGLGVEYYPHALRGLGFRAAFEGDFRVDSESATDESGSNVSLQTFYKRYLLFYAGLQFKF